MSLTFSIAWALFLVFKKTTLRLPWPMREFVLGQFPDEFAAQLEVVEAWTSFSRNAIVRTD